MRTSKQVAESCSLIEASPDVTLPKADQRTGRGRAVLCARVSQAMPLERAVGDQAARAAMDRLLGLAAAAVKAHCGHVAKLTDDGILAVLPTADAAARAACVIMLEADWCEPPSGIVSGMHVGFQAGAIIERGGDVSGDAATVAGRLAASAKSGQILTSSGSAGGISPLVRRAMRRLSGLNVPVGEYEVEEIRWRDSGEEGATVTERIACAMGVAHTTLVLSLGAREWTMGQGVNHLSIGRDPCEDIVVRSGQASRTHGMFEYRTGGIFYSDRSLNGSFISFGDTDEIFVRRGEIALIGQGTICFGHAINEPGDRLKFHLKVNQH
jgi:class 3 adenylate cyclase